MSIFQDLVEDHDIAHRYNYVKRFVATPKPRKPEQFRRLGVPPREEAQVDYGRQRAPTRTVPGNTPPYLFMSVDRPEGRPQITPAAKLLTGDGKLTATRAADVVKRLFGLSPTAFRTGA